MNMPFDETEICDIITDRELEEIGIAYGSKEKYKAAVREAAGKLLLGRSSSVCEPAYPLYGNPFPLGNPGTSIIAESELQNIKRINIVGKKITSVREAAALFSAFRDPRMEIFNILYASKSGEVLAHTAWTLGLPNVVTGKGSNTVDIMRKTMKGLYADKIYVAHNHPSGNTEPSFEDFNVTRNYQNIFNENFGGHIITDHDRFTFILNGSAREYELKKPLKNFYPEINAERNIQNQTDAALAFKNILEQENNVSVLSILDRSHRVISWNYLNQNAKLEYLYGYMRVTGGSAVIVLSNNEKSFVRYENMAFKNQTGKYSIFLDVIKTDKYTGLIEKNVSCHHYEWHLHHSKRPLNLVNNTSLNNKKHVRSKDSYDMR